MRAELVSTIKIFYCYAHEDDDFREQLVRHLSPLQRLRQITGWFDRNIQAGTDWEQEVGTHLDSSSIILLLISADFIASDYCYTIEMKLALEKHKAGTACVIPIILRPVAWEETPIGGLPALPTGKKPITKWANRDEAWLNVVQGISEVVRTLLPKQILSPQETGILYPELKPAATPAILPTVPTRPTGEANVGIPSQTSGVSSRRIPRRKILALSLLGAGLTVVGIGVGWWETAGFPFTPQASTLLTYRGHSGSVLSVSWSPDGRSIASGGAD